MGVGCTRGGGDWREVVGMGIRWDSWRGLKLKLDGLCGMQVTGADNTFTCKWGCVQVVCVQVEGVCKWECASGGGV